MDDPINQAEYGVAVLAGKRIPIFDPVPENNLARFQPKQTSGDFTRDSDDLLSVRVNASWIGGGQAYRVNAISQDERYWDSDLDTEFPNILSLRTKTYSYMPPSGVSGTFYPLGDFGDTMYGAWDNTLCQYNIGTNLWIEVHNLDGAPVAKPVVYNKKLYIPLGATGINVWDGLAAPTLDTQKAISLAIWDDKIAALTPAGEYVRFDGTAWTAPSSPYTIKDGSTPRKLTTFVDRGGDPTIYITTSRGMWAVDPVNLKLFKVGGEWPPHPTQARASCVWRTTDMYISVGIGAHTWDGSTFRPMGLDRNDGLPIGLRGFIVDFEPEYNGMIALVAGQEQDSPGNTLLLDPGMNRDQDIVLPGQSTISSLWRWSGFGWHRLWKSSSASGTPTWTMVSAQENGSRYGLWWGYGGEAYFQPLRLQFYNPQQGARARLDHYEATGVHDSGIWNANMPSWPKLGSHVDINLLEESLGTVNIEYMTDRTRDIGGNLTWISLGQVSQPGHTRLYLGDAWTDGFVTYGITRGIQFDWIRFRYTFDQWEDPGDPTNDTTTPMVDSFVFKFAKIPLQTYSWTLSVPIYFDEQYYDVGPNEMSEFLSGLASSQEFIPFVFKDKLYRVCVAQSQASKFSGDDPHAKFDIIVLEVS